MLLDSGCSNVSEALAHIVPYWNIIQVLIKAVYCFGLLWKRNKKINGRNFLLIHTGKTN